MRHVSSLLITSSRTRKQLDVKNAISLLGTVGGSLGAFLKVDRLHCGKDACSRCSPVEVLIPRLFVHLAELLSQP